MAKRKKSDELARQGQLLSQIVKTIRELRHMSGPQVAKAMGLPERTYYNFEAGTGALDIARVFSFADATNSDPVGIIEGVILKSAEHALRCMNNQASAIKLASARRFEDKVGDRMTNIESQFFIEAFRRAYDSLEGHMDKTDQGTERWLSENPIRPDDR